MKKIVARVSLSEFITNTFSDYPSGPYYVSANTIHTRIEKYEDKVTKDIIYRNIEKSNKLRIEDTKSGGFSILAIDTKLPIITFEPINENRNDEGYIFLVDIQDLDEFKYKTNIETKEDLNRAIEFTINALESHPVLSKYVDDIENLKL